MKRQSQQGVALVITLILLSVITFMAVTFLVVSRHEGEQVNTTTQQTVAKFAADAIAQQAEAQIMAIGLGQTNALGFSLIVSTNITNPFYDKNSNPLSLTNVSYYDPAGNFLSGNSYLQMLNNLLYLPRAPVFVSTNRTQVPEFRFYHDLNRNEVYDTNGPVVELDSSNGFPIVVTNIYVGDPEWIGFLEHPDQRHSASNFFVARGAFIAVPIGNTLDINFIHNQAKAPSTPTFDGFLRNQGVGSWEINLAAFLRVLNPNVWGDTIAHPIGYQYNPTNADFSVNYGPSFGTAFQDAAGILQYRYNGNFNNLSPFGLLYSSLAIPGVNPAYVFSRDNIDGYSAGPLMTNLFPLVSGTEMDFPRMNTVPPAPWSGADNPKQFFTSQDFFSSSPFLNSFSNNLNLAGRMFETNSPSPRSITNSLNRYTFYRMLAQMGLGTAPESAPYPASRRMNLNYNNLGSNTTALVATNFMPWAPIQFFTNAANRLLANAGYNFTVTNIPIYPTNFYTPAVHRLLQLAANIYDASTNRAGSGADNFDYPSVFRPTFNRNGTNIFINGYVEELPTMKSYNNIPLSLQDQPNLINSTTTNVYRIPWVIGAKKGLPNLNEISMKSISQFTRRLQVDKIQAGAARGSWHTNIQYIIGISNVLGVEVWNSYSNQVQRSINIIVVDNFTSTITNEFNLLVTNFAVAATNYFIGPPGPLFWPGFPNSRTSPAQNALSFQIPIYTNIVVQPDSVYRQSPVSLLVTGTNTLPFEATVGNPQPHFVVNFTNRLRFIMVDALSQRVIDYVQLDGMDGARDLTAELPGPTPDPNNAGVWDLSRVARDPVNGPINGVINQVSVSLGNVPNLATVWAYTSTEPLNNQKQNEITRFNTFMQESPAKGTNLIAQAPFTPTRKATRVFTWQANDPLVHYTLGDLTVPNDSNTVLYISPPNSTAGSNFALVNMGAVNDRYSPWGGNPLKTTDTNAFVLGLKDPMVTKSDDWQFSTNKYPNIGWLGKVHRGTPWQTVYLKSDGVNSNQWQDWSGDHNPFDALVSQPTNDWKILDLFTTAPNDNASRGQLSINQTNLAAWAAVLDGVMVMSNTPFSLAPVPVVIDPTVHSNAFTNIIFAINTSRSNYPGGVFTNLGQILSVPQLTVASPFLNLAAANTLNDAAYERIPQQIMSLLRVGSPRYAIFAYGQSLKPADRSIVQSGPFFGMCTNYQITGEVLTRTIVRFDNTPITGPNQTSPRAVIESFNILGPD